jgi:hypothetical protein
MISRLPSMKSRRYILTFFGLEVRFLSSSPVINGYLANSSLRSSGRMLVLCCHLLSFVFMPRSLDTSMRFSEDHRVCCSVALRLRVARTRFWQPAGRWRKSCRNSWDNIGESMAKGGHALSLCAHLEARVGGFVA